MNYKEQFKDKKITVIGLGEHREMLPEIKFLLKAGAVITLIDSRSRVELEKDLGTLKESAHFKYFSCEVSPSREDVRGEIALLAPHIDPDSHWIQTLVTHSTRVETPHTLLFSYIPPVTLIGITGACGKSTVAHLVLEIFKKSFKKHMDHEIHYVSSEGSGVLQHLKKINKDNIIITKIHPSHISLYVKNRIIPQVLVITGLEAIKKSKVFDAICSMLHLHTYNNFVVASDDVVDLIKQHNIHVAAKILRTGVSLVPSDWELRVNHHHEKENIAFAFRVGELFKVLPEIMRDVCENYRGLEGRLELVKNVKGVEFYNDASSVSPLSTLTALKALSNNRNVVLIIGGIYQGEHMEVFLESMVQYVAAVILIPGSGTMRLHKKLMEMPHMPHFYAESISKAVELARLQAGTSSRILFSPGFPPGGVERSINARSAAFVKSVKRISLSRRK